MGKTIVISSEFNQQQEVQVLDIYQLQILNMYDTLLNEEDFFQSLAALAGHAGYLTSIEEKDGKRYFYGCNPEHVKERFESFRMRVDIHSNFEWGLILLVKRMLTAWHQKWALYDWYNNMPNKIPYVQLTHEQRGVLTKILKMENKRKHLLKQLKQNKTIIPR